MKIIKEPNSMNEIIKSWNSKFNFLSSLINKCDFFQGKERLAKGLHIGKNALQRKKDCIKSPCKYEKMQKYYIRVFHHLTSSFKKKPL